ncbi:pyrroloquinoline quinone precursor peptide PqqA [Hyphomicrobium sp.]|jgi:pyrroloquinoline quinone biosynthesis protein A
MTSLDAACLDETTTLVWAAPAYCDVRLGFEVTAYVYVR